MATTPATRSGLIGFAAVAVLAVPAAVTPDGPWQPVAVAMGWVATAVLAAGVVFGRPAVIALAVALGVLRTGVLGLAGDRSPGLAVSAFLLVLSLELASLSLEMRTLPVDQVSALARALAVAAVTGVVTGIAGWILAAPNFAGPGLLVVGLAAALATTGLVLGAARRVG